MNFVHNIMSQLSNEWRYSVWTDCGRGEMTMARTKKKNKRLNAGD